MNRITIYQGDVRAGLQALADNSVHCVVTSPPYWGLRDYGLEPQIWMLPDEDCPAHEWGETKAITRGRQHLKELGEKLGCLGGNKHSESADKYIASSGQFCSLCGTWRGSYGLEPLHDCLGWATGVPCGQCYICHSVQIFREVRRVLRPDGTLWLNIGDSYSGSGGAGGDYNPGGLRAGQPRYQGTGRQAGKGPRGGLPKHTDPFACPAEGPNRLPIPGLKAKDLCGIPFRLALALQADGWWLRRDIIWAKLNPMPESCTDRPTTAHEFIFLLTKSARYFYDAEAVKEDCQSGPSDIRKMVESKERIGGYYKENDDLLCKASKHTNIGRKRSVSSLNGRNLRSVWEMATAPFPEAHFATFPASIPERCIKAGTSEKGCCPHCGAPWQRVVEKVYPENRLGKGYHDHKNDLVLGQRGVFPAKGAPTSITLAWRPTCRCPHTEADLIPATVLDPFSGAMTTPMVAAKLGRQAVAIELSPAYVDMGIKRLKAALGMLAEVDIVRLP